MLTRSEIQRKLFPAGIPKLWCPTLSYFSAAGQFDTERIAQHMQKLSPYVRGILVPGSTGEGWEMTDHQIMNLLDIVVPLAAQFDMKILIGILKTDTDPVLSCIEGLSRFLSQSAVVGVTVCAAKGAERSQEDIRSGLARVLRLQIPTALYQLPQVTQNEMSAETVASLAEEHPNFIMFKDTSGQDRVALSMPDSQGVFMVRGSEQNGYSQWLRSSGGNYDGFLLSTANCFAGELNELVRLCDTGQRSAADRLSDELQQTVSAAFAAFSDFGVGNPFTNANKAIDHVRTYGSEFRQQPAPMLISGTRLPMNILEKVAGMPKALKPLVGG